MAKIVSFPLGTPKFTKEQWELAAVTGRDLMTLKAETTPEEFRRLLHEFGFSAAMAECFMDVARVAIEKGAFDGIVD